MKMTLTHNTSRQTAPRRCWWLRIVIVVILAGLTGLGYWIHRGIEIENDWRDAETKTDAREPRWRLAEREADLSPIDDADNAAVLIKRVLAQAPELRIATAHGYHEIFAKLKPTTQLNSQQVRLIEEQFCAAPAAVAEARKLKDMPRGRFAVNYTLDYFHTQYTESGNAESVSEWLMHDAYLMAQEERPDDALGNVRAILNVAQTCGDGRSAITYLRRRLHQCLALETAERVLAQGEASSESLLELQRLIAREMNESRWADVLKGERAGIHFCYDNLRTGKVTRDPLPLSFWRDKMTVWEHLEERYPQWKLKYYPAHLRFANRLIEIAELPLHEQKAKFNELAKEEGPIWLGYFTVFNCLTWQKLELGRQAKLRTSLVAVACERYRLQQKRWPASLDVLVAEKLLTALPVDPVDGQPLRYREDAEGVIVYSVGPDETDNQGNIRRATPVEPLGKSWNDLANEPGADVGFRLWNVPRRRDAALPAVVIREPRDNLGPAGPADMD